MGSSPFAPDARRPLTGPLCPTPPICRIVTHPHYLEMSFEGVMSNKKASNYPGLHPMKGQ